jgi:hypothetical protein
MKKLLFLLCLLLLPLAHASLSPIITDDFYAGNNCSSDTFNCGTFNDSIIAQNGTFSVNISNDDFQTRAFCAILISGSNATATTCIFRNSYALSSCDSFSTVSLGNHSDYFPCTSSNMSLCGWNNLGNISKFGNATPKRTFQIDARIAATTQIIFTSYICNGTPNTSTQNPTSYFRVVTNKQTFCAGNAYQSGISDNLGTAFFSDPQICLFGFCDPGLNQNISIQNNFSQSFCAGGCKNNIKDGGETDIDYGGVICGNCTPTGKAQDEFYGFAKELQEGNRSFLSNNDPFNASVYCPAGKQVAGVGLFDLLLVLLSGGFIFVFIILFLIILIVLFVILGRFLKKKHKTR